MTFLYKVEAVRYYEMGNICIFKDVFEDQGPLRIYVYEFIWNDFNKKNY